MFYCLIKFLLFVIIIYFIFRSKTIVGGLDIIKDLKKSPRSRCESSMIKYLETITGKKFPSVNPDWLIWKGKTLELDGYNKELNLAVEFSGPLHTKWSPSYESYETYFKRIVRDIVKQKITKNRGVHFFVLDISLPYIHWRNYILSRLHDFGIIEQRPVNYIREQIAKPFRNKELEKELGLDSEWEVVKAL